MASAGKDEAARKETVASLKAGSTTPASGFDDSKDHNHVPTKRFHRTDMGNAEYFTERYGNMVRYDQRRHRHCVCCCRLPIAQVARAFTSHHF